jgi:hypothetical protein
VGSDLQSQIASLKNRIYNRTVVAHIATRYYLAASMARDGEIDLSYVPTAEMLADCITNPLLKPTVLKQCAAIAMIMIALRNGLRIRISSGIGNGLSNTLQHGRGNGIGFGTGNGIGNAIGM